MSLFKKKIGSTRSLNSSFASDVSEPAAKPQTLSINLGGSTLTFEEGSWTVDGSLASISHYLIFHPSSRDLLLDRERRWDADKGGKEAEEGKQEAPGAEHAAAVQGHSPR